MILGLLFMEIVVQVILIQRVNLSLLLQVIWIVVNFTLGREVVRLETVMLSYMLIQELLELQVNLPEQFWRLLMLLTFLP
jgi:hypothetical protein